MSHYTLDAEGELVQTKGGKCMVDGAYPSSLDSAVYL